MGNLISCPCAWKSREKEYKDIIKATMTKDMSTLPHHHFHYEMFICEQCWQSKLSMKEHGRCIPKNHIKNEDPEKSHRTAGSSSSTYQGTEESNNKKHLCLKPKEDFNKSLSRSLDSCFAPLQQAVIAGCYHIIPDLLKRGARIDDRDNLGKTALHLASQFLKQEAIKMLLDCGASINLTTPVRKETALHLAVWSSSCKAGVILAAGSKCVELLLLHGANVHMKDCDGHEAIHIACQNGREVIINLLLNYGADVNSLTQQKESALFLFLEKQSNLRKWDVLEKLINLSYPLKLTNYEGCFPTGLSHHSQESLKKILRKATLEVRSLQHICTIKVRKIYAGNEKSWLKGRIPTSLWNSIYMN